MRRLTFFLSGEHSKIPSSEVAAAIEAENRNYKIVEKLDQILTVETDANPALLSRRLGMCHWIGEHFCTCGEEDLIEAIGSSDILDFLPQSRSIAVRVRRVKKYLSEIDTQKLAQKIADAILEKYDYNVDLENPHNEIACVLSEGKCVVTKILTKVKRQVFQERKPSKRAFVHPSTMQPNLARALVNLARTPRNGTFLDPFCGVGGILIEAGLIGSTPIGVDINPDLIEGSRKNLKERGIKEFELQVTDAKDLDIGKVDAIATDPPYGRQASTGGSELKELYVSTLPVLTNQLKSEKYLCITAPTEIDLEKMSEDLPLNIKDIYRQRVHKSLTRNIYVFQREKY